MILSNREIHRAIDERRLIISPEPRPRLPEAGRIDCPYQTSAVDLRLADEISYFNDDLALDINLSRGGFAKLFGSNSQSLRSAKGSHLYCAQTDLYSDEPWSELNSQLSLTDNLLLPELRARVRMLDAACWFISPHQPFILALPEQLLSN